LAAAASPDNDVLFYNLGLIYSRDGLFDDAVAAFRRSDEINPRHLASEKKPRAADRLQEMIAERDRLRRLEATLAQDPALHSLALGSIAYLNGLADLLETRGESAAARGHRLQALEAAASR
jgi:tetratricopeptide (TPR) repeat protein